MRVPKRLRPSDPEAGPSGLTDSPKERKDTREPIVVSGRLSLGVSECIIGISIISYGKNSLDLRPT